MFDSSRIVVNTVGPIIVQVVTTGSAIVVLSPGTDFGSVIQTTDLAPVNQLRAVSNDSIAELFEFPPAGFDRPGLADGVDADKWLTLARQLAVHLPGAWQEPHVTPTHDRGLLFEWWSGERKLSWIFEQGKRFYLRSWGPDILAEMDDGPIENLSEVALLLKWLSERA